MYSLQSFGKNTVIHGIVRRSHINSGGLYFIVPNYMFVLAKRMVFYIYFIYGVCKMWSSHAHLWKKKFNLRTRNEEEYTFWRDFVAQFFLLIKFIFEKLLVLIFLQFNCNQYHHILSLSVQNISDCN